MIYSEDKNQVSQTGDNMSQQLNFLNDQDLQQYAKGDKDVVIIDVRNPDEYRREHIPGSVNIPVDQLDKTDFSQWQSKTLLFHCQSGNRTKMAQKAIEAIACKAKFCITGGIAQWKSCGLSVEANKKAPLPLMRQVQIVAGLLILIGVVLSLTVSPYFIILTAFVGLGLTFAGISGFCGMANLLMLLPYNKQ